MELTKLDRCDRCSAEALVVFACEHGSLLMFCNHHADQFSDGLAAQGFSRLHTKELVDA